MVGFSILTEIKSLLSEKLNEKRINSPTHIDRNHKRPRKKQSS